MQLTEYLLYTQNAKLELGEGKLYRYILAANGVFVYAKNDIFEACIPVSEIKREGAYVRGLVRCSPVFRVVTKVPNYFLTIMLEYARQSLPNELLMYLNWRQVSWQKEEWGLHIPHQAPGPFSVKPDASSGYVPIEVHSHNFMPAFFSDTDNRDEVGFRVYGVLGRVDQPVVDMRVRVSIYGHRAIIPYRLVFEDHPEVRDA